MLGKKFLMYIFSFLGGILLHSIFLNAFIGDSFLFIILGLSLLLFLFGGKYLKIIALSAVIFLLGFLRFDASINNQQKHVLDCSKLCLKPV